MAHYRKHVAAAAALNTAIFAVETAAGLDARSLSLVMDGIHNFSDELALVALWLAFFLARGPSRFVLRLANLANSLALIIVSGLLIWYAAQRFGRPVETNGIVVIVVGLAAAAANWVVARLLAQAALNNAAIRLAYIHNLGDVWVSLAPVAAGILLLATGLPVFDALIGGGVAVWIVLTTGREVLRSRDELVWPDVIVCDHPEDDVAGAAVR